MVKQLYGYLQASLAAQTVKSLSAVQETWVGKIPWRREWQPTPVFLPGESHGWRSLVGYSPKHCKGSDTTERLHTHGVLKVKMLKCLAIPFSREP